MQYFADSLLPGFINLSHIIAFNFHAKPGALKKDSTLRIMTWNVQDFVDLDELHLMQVLRMLATYQSKKSRHGVHTGIYKY